MLSCREVTQLVSDSMDRQLPLSRRIPMRIHLLMCKMCARYRRQLLLIREAMRRYSSLPEKSEISEPASLPPDAGERIKRSLKERGK